MSCSAPTWSSFGLPLPDVQGYGYSVGFGLVRTRFADGGTLQRRRYWHWPRAWTVQWTVRADVLHTLEAWLASFGYDWFALDLLSGDSSEIVATHQVRVTDDIRVAHVSGGIVRLSLSLEQQAGAPSADITGWSMPCVDAAGYSYVVDSGLISTPFDVAVRRQSRRYTQRPRLYQVQWTLDVADLARAETWINANGLTWFDLRLLSGESATPIPVDHAVRVASDLSISALEPGVVRLSCALEQACANEVGALEAEAADNTLVCTTGLVSSVDLGLDGAGLAADWGDETDWGRLNS